MERLRDLLKPGSRVAVIAHVSPDGDAVGSITALARALTQLDVTAYAVLRDPVPVAFGFLPGADEVGPSIPEDTDLLILLDMNDVARSGFDAAVREYAEKDALVTIDHHPRGDLSKLSTFYVHDEEASSVCEMLADLLPSLGVKITPHIATSLLNGIYTDTGGFQHENAKTRTLETAAELMKRGAKLHDIALHVSRTKSVASLKVMGLALDRMRLTREGACAVSYLSYEDLTACGATSEDIAGIVNEMNAIPTVNMALLLVEVQPGTIRGTMRSGESRLTKVGTLAKVLGGGGHPRAAGFTLSGSINETAGDWIIA